MIRHLARPWVSPAIIGTRCLSSVEFGKRERLYSKRDHVVKLEYDNCRVSIVKCADTAQTGMERWLLGTGVDNNGGRSGPSHR